MHCMRAGVVAFLSVLGSVTAAQDSVALLAPSNNAPFTERSWPHKGMITEIVTAAMAQSPDPIPLALTWLDDAAVPLPALRYEADMTFPWPKPPCDGFGPDPVLCGKVHVSDPVLEVLVLLFVRSENDFVFDTADDLRGKRLCYVPTKVQGERDAIEPDWIADTAALTQAAETVEGCFDRLMADQADAVAINEFQGIQQIFAQKLTEEVVPLPRAVGAKTLHLLISKTHWRATAHIYRFNAGLARLRETGAYSEIVARHTAYFWDQLKR
jgi:polar amino acid transport system substrate-binding protein